MKICIKYLYIVQLIILSACMAKHREEPQKMTAITINPIAEEIPVEVLQPPLTETQKEAWKEEDYPLSWYEGMWLSLSRGYDSVDKDGYLKIEKLGEEYRVEQKYQDEILKGFLYKEDAGRPPYNEPGVFIETDKFIYQISVAIDKYYVYNKALSLSIYAMDVAGYQRESIITEVEEKGWWNKEIE